MFRKKEWLTYTNLSKDLVNYFLLHYWYSDSYDLVIKKHAELLMQTIQQQLDNNMTHKILNQAYVNCLPKNQVNANN